MTVVVADTSPINYLILIGEIGVLQQLYHRVVIPEEVFSELMGTGAHLKYADGRRSIPTGSRSENRRVGMLP
jgi:predicted nucleic acid-binding protein